MIYFYISFISNFINSLQNALENRFDYFCNNRFKTQKIF